MSSEYSESSLLVYTKTDVDEGLDEILDIQLCWIQHIRLQYTPTKRSNAQHLVEYEKQLLYEENLNSGNVMQQPMDSFVCGINSSSESILIRSYLLSARLTRSCRNPVHIFYAKSLIKLSTLKFIPQT